MEGSTNDDAFAVFARRRKALNESLEQSKRAIDSWFDRQPMPASMIALANLEVLLKQRRDLLSELIDLDDDFMSHLIEMRTRSSSLGRPD